MKLTATSVLGFLLGCAVMGCGADQMQQPEWVKNFNPPPAPDGFERFVTPVVKGVQPGENVEWCQWVAAPASGAQDVLALQGYQSPGGHHVVLYATTDTKTPVGTSRICTIDDMLHISFVGGAGGEGTATTAAKLPDGLFLRVPPNMALMANTHWLNATDDVLDGQAVVDVQFAPASNERTPADLFANNGDSFEIAASGITKFDNTCVVGEDLNFAMVTNHMHEHGSSIFTEIIHGDGTTEMIRQDSSWSPEWTFDPQYTTYSKQAPKVVKKGEKIHTHCEWNNTTGHSLTFPDEMCDGIGFYFPGSGQIVCENGHYSH